MNKFKIGDIVQNIDPSYYSSFHGGEIGIVEEHFSISPDKKWLGVRGINGFNFKKGLRVNDDRWKLYISDWDI